MRLGLENQVWSGKSAVTPTGCYDSRPFPEPLTLHHLARNFPREQHYTLPHAVSTPHPSQSGLLRVHKGKNMISPPSQQYFPPSFLSPSEAMFYVFSGQAIRYRSPRYTAPVPAEPHHSCRCANLLCFMLQVCFLRNSESRREVDAARQVDHTGLDEARLSRTLLY